MGPARRVTITDIARLAGVSPGAVSFALNGRPGVSEETRRRILEIAEQHRWRPSSAARALVGAKAGVVGFAVNRPAETLGAEAFFTDLVAGAQSALGARRIAMQMVLVPSVEEEMATYRHWRAANQVDGVIVIDPVDDDPRLSALVELGLPAVVIGSLPSDAGHPAVLRVDDRVVAQTLFAHLAELGHASIAYVSGPAEFQHTRLRAAALSALEVDGIVSAVVATDTTPDAAAAAVRRLRGTTTAPTTTAPTTTAPTAVVFDSDVMAIAGLRAAQELGIHVPSEMSIAAFDDSAVAALVRPSLTCMTRDTFALGAQAAEFLLEQIDAVEILADREAALPRLTVRESADVAP